MTKLENFLNKFNEKQWLGVLTSVLPDIHEVDRNAAQIWFRFYPLDLQRFLQNAEDKAKAVQKFVMQGKYDLQNQIDTSHHFLYGHRFWNEIKAAIVAEAENFDETKSDLTATIKRIAEKAAGAAKADVSLLVGIAAVGLMTLAQTGFENFKNSKGTIEKPKGLMSKSPDQIVKERAKDDSQGMLGFLKTVNKKFTIVYDETKSDSKFPITSDAQIATAAALDQSHDWLEYDERCIEGVIPVECRSAACGTCWIGILGGAEKLSDVQRLERKQMKVFGYNQPDDAKPILRLACQAKAHGNATIVIPPWNGVFGKKIYNNIEETTLEPATTSAAKLRETIAGAVEDNQ